MKRINIILLGGTKDSTELIKHLKNNYNTHILTTTTTEYGSKLALEAGSDDTISRPLLKDEIIGIINNSDFDLLIDATHPFAEHITQTSVSVSKICSIAYVRFERPPLDFSDIDTSHIIYAKSFENAGEIIAEQIPEGNVLHFAGANTMEEVLKNVSKDRFYPRILKVQKSLEKCEKLGIENDHIIAMKGAASLKENMDLIEEYDASVMITKESGEIGGVVEKIEAANQKDISLIMIKRPIIKELNKKDIVSNLEEFDRKLEKIFGKN
ncbi:precorrin-6A reductase [Methanobrevibacter sp.]|uniref:precorrin-6A reductase n=1 Tax=Methanobrevibacter sp. TaxID=66852 RepID=UPI003890E48D